MDGDIANRPAGGVKASKRVVGASQLRHFTLHFDLS
jgi:hypothetical protein